MVVENIYDNDTAENKGVNIGTDGNIGIQYGSKDKEQTNNGTLSNVSVTEDGIALSQDDLESRGINIDLENAQVITKDEEVEGIDVNLQTQLLTEKGQEELKEDLEKAGENSSDIGNAIGTENTLKGNALARDTENYIEETPEFKVLIEDPSLIGKDISKEEAEKILTEYYVELTGNENIKVKLTDGTGTLYAAGEDTVAIDISEVGKGNSLLNMVMDEGTHAYSDSLEDGLDNHDTASQRVEDIVDGEGKQVIDGSNLDLEANNEIINNIPNDEKEMFYDKETHQEFIKAEEGKLSKEKITSLSKKFGVSEDEVRENQLQFAYWNSLEENNTEYEDKSAFLNQQNELKKQIANEPDWQKRKELEKGLYSKVSGSASIFHNIERGENGKLKVNLNLPNEKYMNTTGEEVVFNKTTGEVIKDGINDGTYNIAGGEGILKPKAYEDYFPHIWDSSGDVKLWVKYGTGPNDPTTKVEREKINKNTVNILIKLGLKPQVDAKKENLESRNEYFEGE